MNAIHDGVDSSVGSILSMAGVQNEKRGPAKHTNSPRSVRIMPVESNVVGDLMEQFDIEMTENIKQDRDSSKIPLNPNDAQPTSSNSTSDAAIVKKAVKSSRSVRSEYKCDICDESIRRLCDFQPHYQEEHDGLKAFQCTECEKAFKDYKRFYRHKRVHNREGLLYCESCKKGFISRQELLKHNASYKDKDCAAHFERFKCRLCMEGNFTSDADLRKHFNDQHSVLKIHKCEICDKCYNSENEYKSHVKFHSIDTFDSATRELTKCFICGKNCRTKRRLDNHMVTKHSDRKPHACDICSKVFPLESALIFHKQIAHLTSVKGPRRVDQILPLLP